MKVAFLKGNGIYDRIIQAGTWGPYSHCEFIFSDGRWFGNKPFSDYSISFHHPYANQTNWDLVEVPAFYNQEESITLNLANKMNGKCYDWKGIFLSQVLPLSMQDDDKYFCSEAVMHVLKALGMFPTMSPLQSPNGVRRLLRKSGV